MLAAIAHPMYSWDCSGIQTGLFLKNIQENKNYSIKTKELKCQTPVPLFILALSNGSN